MTPSRSPRTTRNTQGNPWAPYYNADTGLPRPTAEGQQCDEYPFGSTLEGAAHPRWDFSVRWVPQAENGSAGGVLNQSFYFDDRILRWEPAPGEDPLNPYGVTNDPFWVNIEN